MEAGEGLEPSRSRSKRDVLAAERTRQCFVCAPKWHSLPVLPRLLDGENIES
jgi:hypothetical protein